MRRGNSSRPSPAIIVAVLALVAALAGTALAAPGASTSAISKKKVKKIATKQINELAPSLSVAHADTAESASTAETANTANSATNAQSAGNANTLDGINSTGFLRFGAPVPSGVTITGAFGDLGSPPGDNGGATDLNVQSSQREMVSFPVPAPANLTDAQINFAPGAEGGDDDATCTGTANSPSAPPGKVCIYPSGGYGGTALGTGVGNAVPNTNGRYGFRVQSDSGGVTTQFSGYYGTWAYTAP